MSQSVTNNPYAAYQPQAFVGMKADSMDDNVDTFACDTNPINFGRVVSRTAAGSNKIQQGGSVNIVGVSVHDHIVGSRGSFQQYDAVNVLTRGRVWAEVSSATGVDDGVVCQFNAADGKFVGTGTATALPHAVFRSKAINVPDSNYLWEGGTMTALAAVVELHYPGVA